MFLPPRAIARASKLSLTLTLRAASWLPIPRTSSTQLPHYFSTECPAREPRTDQEIEKYVRWVKREHGDNLPEGLLSHEEFTIYQRYFGVPTRYLKEGEVTDPEEKQGPNVTLEDITGKEIVTEHRISFTAELEEEQEEYKVDSESELPLTPYRQFPRGIRLAYKQVKSDVQEAELSGQGDPENLSNEENEEEEVEEQDEDEEDVYNLSDDGGSPYMKVHPLTQIGRYATYPSSAEPPEALTNLTSNFLMDVRHKHLEEAIIRIYGDRQLTKSPVSATTRKNKCVDFPIHPSDPNMTEMEVNIHFATVMPGLYAQAVSTLSELRRRLGRSWTLNEVSRILDVGTGGAGVVAWQRVVDAEESANGPKDNSTSPNPASADVNQGEDESGVKATVVTASPALRYRSAQLLENTTFLQRLPDTNPKLTSPGPTESNQIMQPRKLYDLIIASNTVLPIIEEYKRKYHIENLWSLLNPHGGVLLLIEKGNPLGFEAIAGARSHLLEYNIASPGSETRPPRGQIDTEEEPKEVGQIIAPCTNHMQCPMFLNGAGLPARKDWCRFVQRYIRPQYLQRIMGATHRNHEDATFSYLAVRRGKDNRLPEGATPITPQLEDFDTSKKPVTSLHSEESLRSHFHTLPRVILHPLKKKGHVVIDVCTSQGRIERWTVPKSFGKIEFKDARKAQWGDLWALGAKTKILRNLKVRQLTLFTVYIYTPQIFPLTPNCRLVSRTSTI